MPIFPVRSFYMTTREKEILKLRLGLAIQKKIEENKLAAEDNKQKGKEYDHFVDSLRKLEYSSGISYSNIHLLATGTKNTSFTTLSAVIEGLDMKLDEFFANYYYQISESDVEKILEEIAKKKKNKSGAKKKVPKK